MKHRLVSPVVVLLLLFVLLVFQPLLVEGAPPPIIFVDGVISFYDVGFARSVNVTLLNINSSELVTGISNIANPNIFKVVIGAVDGDWGILNITSREHTNTTGQFPFCIGGACGQNITISLNATILQSYAPEFTSQPIVSATEDVLYEYNFAVEDYNCQTACFNLTLENGPSGMTLFEVTQKLSWTPTQTDVDANPHSISIKADDGSGGVTYHNFSITVTNVNDAPVFTNSPSLSAKELVNYSYVPFFTDDDGDTVTYSLVTFPPGMILNTTSGEINWTPTQWQRGTHPVLLRMTDINSAVTDMNFSLIVSPKNNSDPNITSSPSLSATQNQQYTYTIAAEDIDLEPLTYFLTTGPDNAVLTENIITWTPNQTHVDSSPENFVVLVQDNNSGSATQIFSVAVTNVNDPPVITSSPTYYATSEVLYVYQVLFTDLDQDTVTYSTTAFPTDLRINIKSGLVKWIPTSSDINTSHKVTIQANDGVDSSSQTYYILVLDPVVSILGRSGSNTVKITPVTESNGGGAFSFYDFYFSATGITHISARLSSLTVNNSADIFLSHIISLPRNIFEPTHPVYEYIQINPSEYVEENIINATIFFKVNRSFLETVNATEEEIVLLRYNQGLWHALNTQSISDTNESPFLTFEAVTPGFSYFAIAAYNKKVISSAYKKTPTLLVPDTINITGSIYLQNNRTKVNALTEYVIVNNDSGVAVQGYTGLLNKRNSGEYYIVIPASINDTLIFFVHSKEYNLTYSASVIVDSESMIFDVYTNFPAKISPLIFFFILLAVLLILSVIMRFAKYKPQ